MANQDYKERARQREKERKQSVWFKLVEGDNTFRLLPTPAGADEDTSPSRFFEYAVHRDVGPKKIQVRCGKDVQGEGDCWLCDTKIESLKAKGNDARAAALAPRDVFLVQVAKVDEDGNFTGPFLMTPSKTLGDSILRLLGSKKRDYDDAKRGFNLTVSRTGTGRNDTRYGAVEVDESPSPVPSELIKKIKPFDELKEIPVYSEGAQKAAYQGIDYVPDEDDDEEAPTPRKKPNAKKPAPVADDDDDGEEAGLEVDGEDLEDIEDVEEEPAPKKPTGKKRPAPEPEDDDEPAPKRPAKPTGKKKPAPEPEPDEDDSGDDSGDDLGDLDDLEDLEDLGDDDDTPPAKPTGKKKPAPVEDDDDEPAPRKPAVVNKKKPAPEPPPRRRR